MRKFLVAAALFLGVMFIITNFAEVEAILETLNRGDWRFLLLALFVQAVWLLNVAAEYRAIYRALGLEERIEILYLLAAAGNFVNVITLGGVMGGVPLFIAQARRRGQSAARATLAGVLFILFEYAGFICVLAVGLIVLVRRGNLTLAEIIASAILLAIALTLAALLYLGMRSAEALGKALAWMAGAVNWVLRPFLKRDYLSQQRGHEFARDAASGLQALRADYRNLLWPFALALSNKAIMLTNFFLMFMAFKVPFSTGTLIAGYSVGYLFTIVSPTPAGLGVVEGVLTIVLRSLHVSLGSAAVITLAYRGFTFWIPLLFGMLALRWLERIHVKSEIGI